MSTTNIQGFSKDISDWVNEAGLMPGQILKKVAFDLHGEITRRTPVDTGRARASWVVSIGQPSDEVQPKGEYGPPEFPENVVIDGREPVYLTNALPYIEALENGHSRQAPNGFLALSIEAVNAKLDAGG